MIAVTAAVPVLMAVKLGILPVPDKAKPIDELVLTQVKESEPVGPVVGLVKLTGAVADPLHTV